MKSHLSENWAKNLQNGDVHLAQIPDFEMRYLKNHLAHIKLSPYFLIAQ